MTTETPQSSYDKWRRHFNNMIEGKVASENKLVAVKDRTQVGRGVEIVSPAAQTLDMARALVKRPRSQKAIKRKKPAGKTQSKRGRRTVRKTSTKKRTKKQRRTHKF